MGTLDVLYWGALMTAGLATVVLTAVDILRRPTDRRVSEAWVNWSAPRGVAIAAFFTLFFLGVMFRN